MKTRRLFALLAVALSILAACGTVSQSKPSVSAHETYPVTLDPTVSLHDQIKAGNYGYTDSYITPENFPLTITGNPVMFKLYLIINSATMPETPTTSLKPAIYARVSTEEQREGQTINSQVAELERFATEKGWEVAGIYKDEGWSGAVMARPELDRLRDDARRGLFQAVLINDVDRLARDVSHLGVIKRDLEKYGVQVIFRKLPSEASPTFNLMVNILGSFAEFERELITDRTRRGRRYKIEVRKQYLGSKTSYGYEYVRKDRTSNKDGSLKIVSEEAAVVRQIYEWVDQYGLSARGVTNRLNKLSILPRSGAPMWARSSILRILRNEMYAGVWHYNKHQGYEPETTQGQFRYHKHLKSKTRVRPKKDWVALELPESLVIVPRETWARVQQRVDRNVKFSPRNSKHSYLLKGLVRCGACGASYVGDPAHGYFTYRCIARCKKSPTVIETTLNDAVWQAVEKIILRPDLVLTQIGRRNDAETRGDASRRVELEAIDRDTRQLRTEEARLLEAYRLTAITPAQLGQELEKLRTRSDALKARALLHDSSETVSESNVEKSVTDYCTEAARNLASFDFDQRREFLRTLIRTIFFDGRTVRIRGEFQPSHFRIDENRPETSDPNISVTEQIGNTSSSLYGRNPADDGRIAPTEIQPSDRKPSHIEVSDVSCCVHHSAVSVSFEVRTEIVKDRTRLIAANRANLVKANTKRWAQYMTPPEELAG